MTTAEEDGCCAGNEDRESLRSACRSSEACNNPYIRAREVRVKHARNPAECPGPPQIVQATASSSSPKTMIPQTTQMQTKKIARFHHG